MPKQPRKGTDDGMKPKKSRQTQDPKPTGTKGEEISSQGQLDEGSRKRTR